MDPVKETNSRIMYAKDMARKLSECTKAIMVTGSVAYGNNYSVKETSDLDIFLILKQDKFEKLKTLNKEIFNGDIPEKVLEYMEKDQIDMFHVDILMDYEAYFAFWSENFFERITNNLKTSCCRRFVKKIRTKEILLKNFNNEMLKYRYSPKYVDEGIIVDYPTHIFDKNNIYWAGVPVEVLLSEPIVISGDSIYVYEKIYSLIKELVKQGFLEKKDPDIKNLLIRKDRFSPETNIKIDEKVKKAKLELNNFKN